jgi:peptidylprolyl isomerase
MRYLIVLGVVLWTLAFTACGGGSSARSNGKPATSMTKLERAKLTEPKVEPPNGPPPKKLVVLDLKKGSGAAAKKSDVVLLDYVGESYETGKVFESTWSPGEGPRRFPLNEVIKGWEDGLTGMRVGGRRELSIPSRLAYDTGPLIYVVDLLAIE